MPPALSKKPSSSEFQQELSGPRPLAFRRLFGRKLRVELVVDPGPMALGTTEALASVQGCIEALEAHPDLELRRNSTGSSDLVHFLGWGPAFLAGRTRRARRRIATIAALPVDAGSSGLDRFARPAIHGWLRTVAHAADAMIADTAAAARQLQDLGVHTPVWTLPSALPDRFVASPELRRRGRALLGLGDERIVVLGVGGLRREDGVEDFAAVARSLPTALFLWVDQDAGRGPSEPAGIDAFVADGPPNLRFAGALPDADLPAVFNAADLLLHPAWAARGPGAALLAAGCGLPTVVRDLPAHRRPWEGEMLAAADVGGFVRAVGRLLGSQIERVRWASLSRRQAEPHRAAAVAERLLSLYDLAACGKLAPRRHDARDGRARLVEWTL